MALSPETENVLLHRAHALHCEGKHAEAEFLLTDAGKEAVLAHDAQQKKVNEELAAFLDPANTEKDTTRLEKALNKLLKMHGIGKPRVKSLIDARGKCH